MQNEGMYRIYADVINPFKEALKKKVERVSGEELSLCITPSIEDAHVIVSDNEDFVREESKRVGKNKIIYLLGTKPGQKHIPGVKSTELDMIIPSIVSLIQKGHNRVT